MVFMEGHKSQSSYHTAAHRSPHRNSQKWPPKDDAGLGALMHIYDHKITGDDELTYLNKNILQNTYKLPEGEIF